MSIFRCAQCDNPRDADAEDHCEELPDGGVICGACLDARVPEARVAGKWRKRPIEVEAWHYPGGYELPKDAPDWLWDAYVPSYARWRDGDIRPGYVQPALGFDDWGLRIGTLEGVMGASAGDWIIRGVKGELYPCKPDIFAATYEPALSSEEQPSACERSEQGNPATDEPK